MSDDNEETEKPPPGLSVGDLRKVLADLPEDMTTHVDDFVSDYKQDAYARWVLLHFRLPATQQNRFWQFMKEHKLFCTYEGARYRCIGASRLGDVWLTSDFSRENGYEKRVDVSKCEDWGAQP